jgi:hypothetical protein
MTQAMTVHRAENGGGEIVRNVNVGDLLGKIVESGLTADSAAAVKELVMLQNQQQAREAKQSFVEAFARVKEKVKTINATRANCASKDKGGGVRWWMADIVDLQNEIEPVLKEEGMTLSFDTRRDGPTLNILTGICIVTHTASGHEERREFGVNVANAQGGDMGAGTTAKRGALIAMFALRVRHDDNARVLGDVISPEQLAELQARARTVGADEKKLLAFAGAADWKSIRQGKLGQLHDFLRLKEKKQAEGAGGSTGTFSAPAPSVSPTPTPAPIDAPAPEATREQENARIVAEEYLDGELGGDANKIRSYAVTHNFYKQAVVRAGGAPRTGPEWRAVAINCHILQQQQKHHPQ